MNPFTDRCAKPKPSKGSLLLERHAKRKAIKAHEDAEKRAVRLRDRSCRWPGCDAPKSARLEVAHLDDKGMGGDHGERTSRDRMMLLCVFCHQGPHSLHSKTKRVEPLTSYGTDGPCGFYELSESGDWVNVANERTIGVMEVRR